jgi:hypothetical protein
MERRRRREMAAAIPSRQGHVYPASTMRGSTSALCGAMLLAALNTFGDFAWARYVPGHRAVFGLIHGTLLLMALGLYLGALRGRIIAGAVGGAAAGFAAAAGFYLLAPFMGYSAMFVAWVGLWIGFAALDARVLRLSAASADVAVRGVLAALGSGIAFYAVSGIWLRPSPGGPDYPYHFLCWTLAFLPGLLALLVNTRGSAAAAPSAG